MDQLPAAVLDDVVYSDKYSDDHYEYRHVTLNTQLTKLVPRTHLMSETEWRNLGVQQVAKGHISKQLRHYLVFLERWVDPLHDAHAGAACPHVQEEEDDGRKRVEDVGRKSILVIKSKLLRKVINK